MRTSCLVAFASLVLVGASAQAPAPASQPPPAAEQVLSLEAMREFVFAKMAYDEQYFGKVMAAHEQGRPLPGTDRASFGKEVTRAERNLPLLARFAEEKAAFLTGKPFTTPGSGATHREYKNLITLLNMFQAHDQRRPRDVIRLANEVTIEKPDDLGQVRGDGATFYVSMYRSYFYLVGSAHYALSNDDKAIEWFARLQADKDLVGLKDKIAKEAPDQAQEKTLRLDELRAGRLAVMPFANQTGDAGRDWMGAALAEVLTVDLAQNSDLTIVERAQIEKVAAETALALGGFTDPGQAHEVGGMLGAGTLLLGGVQLEGGQPMLTLRLVETGQERVVAAASGVVTDADLFTGARTLLLELLQKVGWDDGVLKDELLSRHAPQAKTAKSLHEARLLLATKQDQAKALYAKALREDPALANLYEDLKAQFKDVGATVAVMPFLNVSGRDEDAWMPRGVLEALSTDLPKLGFQVVERARVDALAMEQLGKQDAFLDAEAAGALGKALNADFMVLGSVMRQKPMLRVDLRFVEVSTGLIVHATSAENRRDDLMAAISSLTRQIAQRFNAPLDDKAIDALVSSKMSQADLEKIARQQLAQDALVARAPVAADGAEGAGIDLPAVALWSSLGTVGVGAATAATGFLLAQGPAAEADQLHGRAALLGATDVAADLRTARDAAALQANIWTAVGWAGVGVATLGTAGLVGSALWLAAPDEETP